MSASSTHDTKRSEDARARLHVLSEAADLWRLEVLRWGELNARFRVPSGGEQIPGPNTEYLIYQSLVAAWPARGEHLDDTFRERLSSYLTKAMREMKAYTSWTNANEEMEATIQGFLATILDPRSGRAFIRRIGQFVEAITPAATSNSLAMLTIKATAPGFPDFYQGTEFWDRSLTDPDNRRPVDYTAREQQLAALDAAPPTDLAAPVTKLWLTRQLLRLRAEHHELFATGDYSPLATSGRWADNLFAFARQRGAMTVVVVVPRLTTQIVGTGAPPPTGAAWGDTTLALPTSTGGWRNWLTGEIPTVAGGEVGAAELLATLPFAILTTDR
jgi:(1->4)-alpha-D-glucan 1-alpha-D-glucosylmutase